jgi:hypothetical protein
VDGSEERARAIVSQLEQYLEEDREIAEPSLERA